ncbi:MAG TPA: V-type ATP synthase subunit I, partial [Clostridiaceae bacterium]|nr:V-type ATP synthase subunit I [Clostridiaceae bacterium]
MMMADAGYGLIMGIAAALMLKYTNIEGNMRKIIKVLLYCSPPTVIFGLLYGSFFGGIIPLKPLWVSPVDNT